jgi:hypothetical protein
VNKKWGKMKNGEKWAGLSAYFFSILSAHFFSISDFLFKKIFSIYIGAAQLPSASLYCQSGFVPA